MDETTNGIIARNIIKQQDEDKMVKQRIGQQLKEIVGHNKHRHTSADLNNLSLRFEQLKIKIRQLVDALRAQHLSLIRLNETRLLVAKKLASLAENSPIHKHIGNLSDDSSLTSSSEGLDSFMSIHYYVSNRHKMYSDRFLKYIVEYAIEWEKVIVGRISTALKKAESLRRDLDHYSSKVEHLHLDANKTMVRGKMVKSDSIQKLQRNEEKLRCSRGEYESYTHDLCKLIEEVTVRAWMDLHPLVLKLVQFDITTANDEQKSFQNLTAIAMSLKQLAGEEGLKPETRLRELEDLCAQVLERKQLTLEPSTPTRLAITNGAASTETSGEMHNNQDHSYEHEKPRSGAFDITNSMSSTYDMISIATKSAPPPTMADINAAVGGTSASYSDIKNNDFHTSSYTHRDEDTNTPYDFALPKSEFQSMKLDDHLGVHSSSLNHHHNTHSRYNTPTSSSTFVFPESNTTNIYETTGMGHASQPPQYHQMPFNHNHSSTQPQPRPGYNPFDSSISDSSRPDLMDHKSKTNPFDP